MKIAVIGTGSVGSALGTRWARECGHSVFFGSRNPDSSDTQKLLDQAGKGASAVTPADAAGRAEVVVLAVPWEATQGVVESLGDLTGKVVVDCTNPLKPQLAGLTTTGGGPSGGEQVASWAKGARVVKAFNTTGANNMEDPTYDGDRVMMPICGDDEDAKTTVRGLAAELGFDVVDAGPLARSRELEHLAFLWIFLAYDRGFGREIGFGLLRR